MIGSHLIQADRLGTSTGRPADKENHAISLMDDDRSLWFLWPMLGYIHMGSQLGHA